MLFKGVINGVTTCFRNLHSVKENVARISPALTDYFYRKHNYLRISVTERCSFRCQYCMPEEGVPLTPKSHLLTNREIFDISSLFVKLGVDKIRLTGGEPLLRKDIVELIGNLSSLQSLHTIAMTTNGLILHRKLKDLKNAGLTAINISLDSLISPKFEFITRRKGLNHVLRSIESALDLGFNPVKINCVVMKGINDDELGGFVKYSKDKNVDIRFIEYCPFGGNKWNNDKMMSYSEMLNSIKKEYPELVRLPDLPNDTSKGYMVPGFVGRIGFITSMSENFCSSCNRLRITADGNLKVCLFGKEEVSLRDAMRQNASEEELISIISSAVLNKKKQHAEFLSNLALHKLLPKNTFSAVFGSYNTCSSRNKAVRYFEQSRHFSTNLTHVNEKGEINMVDVSSKTKTVRCAEAEARIYLGPKAYQLVNESKIKKGDVLSVANISGIMAAKKTCELIPLCHAINIDQIKLNFTLLPCEHEIVIHTFVKTEDRTGAEMEALTSASVAALSIYDMCKAVTKEMVIKYIQLTLKTGGKEDYQKI